MCQGALKPSYIGKHKKVQQDDIKKTDFMIKKQSSYVSRSFNKGATLVARLNVFTEEDVKSPSDQKGLLFFIYWSLSFLLVVENTFHKIIHCQISFHLGTTPKTKSSVFLTLFKRPLTLPPPHFEQMCCGLYCQIASRIIKICNKNFEKKICPPPPPH